jgi:hypothetical protein
VFLPDWASAKAVRRKARATAIGSYCAVKENFFSNRKNFSFLKKIGCYDIRRIPPT